MIFKRRGKRGKPMKNINKKSSQQKLPEYLSDLEDKSVQTASKTAVEEIIEKKEKASSRITEERIQELAYYNHLKYPENSELDNWFLAIEQFKNE